MHENLFHSETSSLVWAKQRLQRGFVAQCSEEFIKSKVSREPWCVELITCLNAKNLR